MISGHNDKLVMIHLLPVKSHPGLKLAGVLVNPELPGLGHVLVVHLEEVAHTSVVVLCAVLIHGPDRLVHHPDHLLALLLLDGHCLIEGWGQGPNWFVGVDTLYGDSDLGLVQVLPRPSPA